MTPRGVREAVQEYQQSQELGVEEVDLQIQVREEEAVGMVLLIQAMEVGAVVLVQQNQARVEGEVVVVQQIQIKEVRVGVQVAPPMVWKMMVLLIQRAEEVEVEVEE